MQLRNVKGSKRFSIGDGWSLHDSECNFHCIRIVYSKNKSDTLFGVTFTRVLFFPSVIVFVCFWVNSSIHRFRSEGSPIQVPSGLSPFLWSYFSQKEK